MLQLKMHVWLSMARMETDYNLKKYMTKYQLLRIVGNNFSSALAKNRQTYHDMAPLKRHYPLKYIY